jgi:hypothetical protein
MKHLSMWDWVRLAFYAVSAVITFVGVFGGAALLFMSIFFGSVPLSTGLYFLGVAVVDGLVCLILMWVYETAPAPSSDF